MGLVRQISIFIIAFWGFYFISNPLFAQENESPYTYTVQEGDFILKIATNFGNPNFWEPIYEANKDQIKDLDLIYPGQVFVIPISVTSSPKFIGKTEAESLSAQQPVTQEDPKLKEFREAFAELVRQQQAQQAVEEFEEQTETPKKTTGLEFGGLVINETRSKMGDDFFNVFYQYWEAPANSGNFILKITEQPVPSLGTLVSVKIDDQQVYKSRLQPRYTIIESMAKQAVMISYQTIQQRMQTSNDISIY